MNSDRRGRADINSVAGVGCSSNIGAELTAGEFLRLL